MASKVDQLLSAYEAIINEPWVNSLSGHERVLFIIFDPTEIRKIEYRIGEFEIATRKAGKRWVSISLKNCFPTWMAEHPYKEEYFGDTEALVDQLESEFKQFAIDYLRSEIEKSNSDEKTLIALREVSAIYGFARLSDILNGCSNSFKGRMLVFFPGEYDKNHYRLLNARDGWSYLARPITA
jgi:hypothetical protein